MNEQFEPDFSGNNQENTTPPVQPIEQKQENIVAGIFGALLFSLAGGIIWFLLYQIGYLAAISGIVGVICAIKGYGIFGKRESVKGVIISTVFAFLVIVLAWYLCIGYDIYNAYQEWFANGEIDFTVSFFEALGEVPLFFEESEIALAYLKDLGIGLLFCVIGAFGYVKAAIGKARNK
jgi:hypothetical protein